MHFSQLFVFLQILLLLPLLIYCHSDESDIMFASLAPLRRQKRIAEGYPTRSNLRTSVVSLRSRAPQAYFGDNHFCCGVLLTERFIVTAAQCLTLQNKRLRRPREIMIVMGSIMRLNQTRKTIVTQINYAGVHINYTMNNYNDIGLIRLISPIPKNHPRIDLVPATLQSPPYGSRCLAMGWGRIFKDGPVAATLASIEVELYHPGKCRDLLQYYSPEMLCAGNPGNVVPEGPCPGDTGGPLFCNNSLIGVVSYTIGCSKEDTPTVYTAIWHHFNWLEKQIDRGGQTKRHTELKPTLVVILVGFVYVM